MTIRTTKNATFSADFVAFVSSQAHFWETKKTNKIIDLTTIFARLGPSKSKPRKDQAHDRND